MTIEEVEPALNALRADIAALKAAKVEPPAAYDWSKVTQYLPAIRSLVWALGGMVAGAGITVPMMPTKNVEVPAKTVEVPVKASVKPAESPVVTPNESSVVPQSFVPIELPKEEPLIRVFGSDGKEIMPTFVSPKTKTKK